MLGLVISLQRRPERLQEFRERNSALTPKIDFQHLEAVDGKTLDLTGSLRQRVHPWNFENLDEPMLRGVVGCALSHLAAWERIAKVDAPFALVFEDDAAPLFRQIDLAFQRLCVNLPQTFDVIWLSDWDRSPYHPLKRVQNSVCRTWKRAVMNPKAIAWHPATEKTAEAYVISPAGARRLADFFRDNLGAADEHMRQFAATDPTARFFEASPPLFGQADRSNSDIR